MNLIAMSIAVLLAHGPATQDVTADEKAIRAAIEKLESVPADVQRTADSVWWTGAFVRPVVGTAKPEIRSGSSAGKRTNIKSTITVNQLQVSRAADLAYEYSTVRNAWDRTEDKRHVEFEAAVLRVWRKVDGQWKIAAWFQRPVENTPSDR